MVFPSTYQWCASDWQPDGRDWIKAHGSSKYPPNHPMIITYSLCTTCVECITHSVCMYVCTSMYVHLCMYIYVCTSMYVHLCMYIYVCTSMYVHLCMYIYVCTSMYVHLCIYIYIQIMCLSLSLYIYIYTYARIKRRM